MAKFKEEWLLPDAIIPIDAATTTALVEEIKRMTTAVGRLMLQQAMADSNQKREWVGLTDEEAWGVYRTHGLSFHRPNHVEEYEWALCMRNFARDIEAKLKEKNT